MSPIERHGTTRRYSDVVVHGDTVYLVEVPASLEADIATQTAEVLASVTALLAKGGSDKSRLLMVTLYLRDMADYDVVNQLWDAWIPPGTAPARACIQARLSHPGYGLEVVATAAR